MRAKPLLERTPLSVDKINDKTLFFLEAPVKRITHDDVVSPYFGREIIYIPDVERISRALEETLDS